MDFVNGQSAPSLLTFPESIQKTKDGINRDFSMKNPVKRKILEKENFSIDTFSF